MDGLQYSRSRSTSLSVSIVCSITREPLFSRKPVEPAILHCCSLLGPCVLSGSDIMSPTSLPELFASSLSRLWFMVGLLRSGPTVYRAFRSAFFFPSISALMTPIQGYLRCVEGMRPRSGLEGSFFFRILTGKSSIR